MVPVLGYKISTSVPGVGYQDGSRYEDMCMEAYGVRLSTDGGDNQGQSGWQVKDDGARDPVGALFGVPQLPPVQLLVRGGAN